MTKKSTDDNYQKLTDSEHVLKRPSMYIGTVVPHTGPIHLYNGESVYLDEVTYNPGFIKIFDEIISNSADEHRKNKKLSEIKVTLDLDSNTISVWDNGGIPVKMHTVHKEWIPEMIFSSLRAGSNFDDTEKRKGAGTNGVGSTLTNIYSTKFKIVTCDGTNQFHQIFSKNLSKRTKPLITPKTRKFTEITYTPELSRFKMEAISDKDSEILFKRCLDIAACNIKLRISFTTIRNKKKSTFNIKLKSFSEYIALHTSDYFYEESEDWKIGFAVSNNGFINTSFVNSVHTSNGGTHVEYITNQLIAHLREFIKKKHKVEVKPNDIRNHVHVFIDSTIINSNFDAQTKTKLMTEVRDFGTDHIVSEKLAKAVFKSEIVESVLDWVNQKLKAQENAELRKLNKGLSKEKVIKLIDAQKKGDRGKCTLGIFEGDSAKSAFREYRDPQYQGAFPLRGKFMNVSELSNLRVIKNKQGKTTEAVPLMAAIGLKLGEKPKNLRYGKIYIYTDADPDGDCIAALVINFLNRYWPELFDEGRVYKVLTPLVVAKKGTQVKSFYTSEEYEKWSKLKGSAGWETEYKKGLAALEDEEYKEIIHNPKLVRMDNDKDYKKSLDAWFAADSAPRKERILNGE